MDRYIIRLFRPDDFIPALLRGNEFIDVVTLKPFDDYGLERGQLIKDGEPVPGQLGGVIRVLPDQAWILDPNDKPSVYGVARSSLLDQALVMLGIFSKQAELNSMIATNLGKSRDHLIAWVPPEASAVVCVDVMPLLVTFDGKLWTGPVVHRSICETDVIPYLGTIPPGAGDLRSP